MIAVLQENPFLRQRRYPRSNTFRTSLGVRWRLFLYMWIYSHAFVFHISCFMNKTLVVNHKLCLYRGVPFLFAGVVCLASFILGSWLYLLLFCRIYERNKALKIFLYFLWRRFQSFVILYNVCGIGTHFNILFNIQSFVYICRGCSFDLKQRDRQLMCK